MSNQKNYVPWNKSGSSIYSGSSRKEIPVTATKKQVDSTKKLDYERSGPSKLVPHSSNTSFGEILRSNFNTGYRERSNNSKIKPVLNKTENSHPPITYSLLPRRGSRSRDTSPIGNSEISSSSSPKYNYNRLYPTTHQRSVSRERIDSTTSSTSLSNNSEKNRSNWNDLIKHNCKSANSKEGIPKYTGRLPFSRDDNISPRYKLGSRTASREDLSKSSPKYIKSRFLPKNSVEKSQTAQTKISITKTVEPSRRNKELLNVLQVEQAKERLSRSTSRCSSVTSEEHSVKHIGSEFINYDGESSDKKIEMTKVSRGISPTQESTSNSDFVPKKLEAKFIENKLPEAKNFVHTMHDKGIKSDSRSDSSEICTNVRSSKNVATPWSSFLDMEFSRPDNKCTTPMKSNNTRLAGKNELSESLVLSRTNSTNSLSHVKSHQCDESRNIKKSLALSKSKSIPSKKLSDRKQLPPQIPKFESLSRSTHSQPTIPTNKDFRKSILNMNPDKNRKAKQYRSSNSASSAESEIVDPDNTDVSENLTSCSSYHYSNTSRLPQRGLNEELRRSPSCETSITNTSGSDDDALKRKEKCKRHGTVSPKMLAMSSVDELLFRKSTGSQPTSRPKGDDSQTEADAKSFLMRALAPVTNLFKMKPHNSAENINWMESGTDSEASNHRESEINPTSSEHPLEKSCSKLESCYPDLEQKNKKCEQKPISAKIILRRVEPNEKYGMPRENLSVETEGSADSIPRIEEKQSSSSTRQIGSEENSLWFDKNGNKTETGVIHSNSLQDERPHVTTMQSNNSDNSSWWLNSSDKQNNSNTSDIRASNSLDKQELRHTDSEERPWWLTSSENIPEIVQEKEQIEEMKSKYPIRHQDSGEKPWWLEEGTELNTTTESEFVDDQKPKYAIRHQDSGEKPWWLEDVGEVNTSKNKLVDNQKPKYAIRHQDSGEKPWWLEGETEEKTNNNEFIDDQMPIGDRASPEGVEMSEVDEVYYSSGQTSSHAHNRSDQLFISRHTNIDDVLGCSQIWSPLANKTNGTENNRSYTVKDATQVQFMKANSPCRNFLQSGGTKNTEAVFRLNLGRLDDAALQLYRDGDYGSYLDLEASISEQQEEFDGFQSNRKNSIVLRTQLSVRVHNIIEKLLTSEGRELRRALFSLKQVFQEDKDLVHEFVQNDGLSCLIKVGSEADQNYLNYILRALGQVMLYVDGMNGVMEHNQTVQWLYSLISSKFRLVVKTALKLLLVFVEYADSNCSLLIKAIRSVDYSEGVPFYHNVMKLLKDFDFADTELLIYAMTLINRILNGVTDQDTYYDQIDSLEEQGLETVIQRYMSKSGTDLDLLHQFQIYEAVLQYEDGEEPTETPIGHLDDSIIKIVRNRKPLLDSIGRRKSRRHSTGNSPMNPTMIMKGAKSITLQTSREDKDYESSSSQSSAIDTNLRGSNRKNDKDVGVTPALKRRRERAERQESFIKEQECSAFFHEENGNENGSYANTNEQKLPTRNRIIQNISNRKDIMPLKNAVDILDPEENQPRICSLSDYENGGESDCTNENERSLLLQLKRENTVKDLTQKLANQSIIHSPSEENKMNRIGDMSGLISKAKEGLAKSKTKSEILKQPTTENLLKIETKKSENELRWEELTGNLNRSLSLCDMDFTDLVSEDEIDILAPITFGNGIPPPPPLLEEMGSAPPPPPLSNRIASSTTSSPLVFSSNLQKPNRMPETKSMIQKNKKTVKLFWKEVRDESVSHVKLKTGSIWDELYPVSVDTQKLEHLFETRARDLNTKKQQDMNKNKEIIVLDPKRSNAINIGMTKLPPSRSIKTAILKMDATIMNREGIDKLLTMLPTEEERTKIQDAQAVNPDLPLGSAEQFLLTLASISELPARLKLWAFKLDFENSEREIAEPLMDLKQGIEVLRENYTFRGILSTLLSIGNFLNGNEVKGFQIEYLTKVPEVKDTVHKHSLLHHLCHTVMEKFPNSTDLYSEVGAITRASKVDFDELSLNVQSLKSDCKSSWDHLKLIAKHDGSTTMKVKMSDFLSDCAERIILLEIIHRRIKNRFHKFLLWLGIPLHQISDTKPNDFCRIVSEFALEYRTTRERVLQQLEKKANHRERNKTRGKMITDVGKFKTKEDKADAELRTLLGSDLSDVESVHGTLPWRRTRRDGNMSFKRSTNGNFTDDDDEILESLVKSATKCSSARNTLRERKRTRHVERKSLRRTLKNGLSEEEKKHLSVYIEGYQL